MTDVSALLAWVRHELGATDVREGARLGGSSSATIHTLGITSGDGVEQLAVAKVFDRAVSGAEAQFHVTNEALNLGRARVAGLLAPDPLLWDPSGGSIGAPVIVMTRLPGTSLPRPTINGWIEGLASTLVDIATADVNVDDLPAVKSWLNPSVARPEWFDDRGLWDEALARLAQGLTGSGDRFIHRDFHPLNVLWEGDRVSGVVDWVHAGRGPIDFDIASCRVNIALTAGLEAADQFTSALGDVTTEYDRAWDLDKVLCLCEYVEVLLVGNEVGADVTLDRVCRCLVQIVSAAVRR
jgi:hypothetical protein